MSYQALYRVFRSQSFDEVVGQKHVTTTLKNAISQNKISHAYLFNGPRGTGKTSIAKIFAKAINCTVRNDGEPCNTCPSCISITNGTNTDVFEIDAASNNGVDEIRNIRDKVKYAPAESKYKVYIIDEVHMLTTGAFNALLKTLEEPPSHAIFILATTEPHKIPPTIISRTQRFDFKAISAPDIVEHLAYVCNKESIEYDQEALEYIAQTAEGGMRDALSILDQAIAFGGTHLTLEHALDVTGSVSKEQLRQLLEATIKHDVQSAFQIYHQLLSDGKESSRLINDLIYYLRDVIIEMATGKTDSGEVYTLDLPVIYQMIDEINATLVSMRFAVNSNIHFEVLIVKLSELVKRASSLVSTAPVAIDTSHIDARIAAIEEKLSQTKTTQNVSPRKERATKTLFSLNQIENILNEANRDDLNDLKAKWQDLINHVEGSNNVSLVSLLQKSEPVAASNSHVLIKFEDDIHCNLVNKNPEKREQIESIIYTIINKQVKMVGVPDSQWLQVRHDYIESRKKQSQKAQPKEELDVVQKAEALFGKDTVNIIEN